MTFTTSELALLLLAFTTLGLTIGWLAGNHEREMDDEILTAVEWHDHVHQALFVARRTPKIEE